MPKRDQISVLLLDDNAQLVKHYKERIERYAGFRVTSETDSIRARSLAQKQLFDLVVIDAKLDYRGFEFGGLRLAEDLRPRYGSNSIIVISRYITASLARVYELDCEFMEKYSGELEGVFERDLCRRLRQLRREQYAFVAMPFGRNLLPVYKHIKAGIIKSGFKCIRVDRIPHNRPIQELIFELVRKCKLVVLLADGANPNAYYEAGFADAMKKEVVIVAKTLNELKFDISNRHAIIYGNRPESLVPKLKDKITKLRLEKPLVL